jgi:hypothetical protein
MRNARFLERRSWFDKLTTNGFCKPFALSLSKPVLSQPKGANFILLGALKKSHQSLFKFPARLIPLIYTLATPLIRAPVPLVRTVLASRTAGF